MTRFKELRRIERATENRDETELRWALGYCGMRLRLASLKSHQKTWTQIRAKVETAMASAAGEN